MHITTDSIILIILCYFFYKGWRKGFLKTLLGPVALLIGCFMGFSHYHKTQDITTSLVISIISPFVITILASLVLKLWNKAVNNDDPLPLASRLMGSAFSILWGGGYLAMMVLLIGIMPVRFGWFEKVQDDVLASKSYALVNHWAGDKIPIASLDVKKITNVLQNPEALEQFESTEEFETLMGDDLLKELFADEETAEQIRTKNYSQLLANPKMQAVFQNPELLKKIFALNKKIMEEGLGN